MKKYVFVFMCALFIVPGLVRADATDRAVKAQEESLTKARPLPLDAVRLTGGPLKHAQDITAEYLLTLEADRMMAGYRVRAGLEPKAEGYGGWDAVDSRQLTGHIAGHYLSGISYMYAATGDARFKERVDYLVREMKEVQDKRGNGYLGAIIDREGTDGAEIFEQVSQGNIRSGGFDMNGLWSPWYTLHKTYAGLRDAYRLTGNKTALAVEIKFAEWAERILAPLSDAQIQQMLRTEFGGMNEIMADLYADTGDKRWLDLSYKFEDERMIQPMQRHQDNISGVHGNTTIPKLIGSLDRFAYTGNAADIMAASFFWDQSVHHHTFATGGNSIGENFPPTDQLAGSMGGRGNETCNIYNMLKLTRRLFEFEPDAHYADYLERALFNHILGSIDPETAATCYMVPVGGGRREYSSLYSSFTCCHGSGMETHAMHADGIYYEMGNKLWVNIYAPSTVNWQSQGVKLDVATGFPEGESATIALSIPASMFRSASRQLTLALRKPYWAGDGFVVKVNGEVVAEPQPEETGRGGRLGRGGQGGDAAAAAAAQGTGARRGRGARAGAAGAPGRGQRRGFGGGAQRPPVSSYVELTRTWQNGDTIELTMPQSLRLEPTPDDPTRVAIMWGPLVLAPEVGEAAQRGGGGRRGAGGAAGAGQGGARRGRGGQGSSIPTLVADAQSVSDWLRPVSGQAGQFIAAGVRRQVANPEATSDVNFIPFYRLHRVPSYAYVDVLNPEEWANRVVSVTAEQRRQRLDAATVAFVEAGEMQGERDFNYQSSTDRPVEEIGVRHGRAGTGWFSFDLPVEAASPMALLLSLNSGAQDGAAFEVHVDGTRVATQSILNNAAGGFYDAEVAIPANLLTGKEKVTVRFQSTGNGRIPTVFGVRMIRADAER